MSGSPVEIEPVFSPCKEMKQIRILVRELCDRDDNPAHLVADWVKEIDEFSFDLWENWLTIDGFWAWWLELLPEHRGILPADIKMLEYWTMRSLIHNVQRGDPGATRAVLTLINSSLATQTVQDDEVESWFAAGQGDNGWSQPKKLEKK